MPLKSSTILVWCWEFQNFDGWFEEIEKTMFLDGCEMDCPGEKGQLYLLRTS